MSDPVADIGSEALGETLSAWVDTLLPGDEHFPPASVVGTHGLVAHRIRRHLGAEALDRFSGALGRDFASLDRSHRAQAVAGFEALDPELFAVFRLATVLAYYETPQVIAALRSLGHDYNDTPQPKGYAMAPFDHDHNLPADPRGIFKRTEEITRVDLTSLSELDLPVHGG